MGQNNKEKKSLKLNKETLMRLQDEQLKAAMGGGAELISKGQSSQCPSVDTCGCPPGEPVSCCKKSCQGGGGHTP